MTRTRPHTCVFFDDGEPELRCACGRGALAVSEDGGAESLLVRLADDCDVSGRGGALVASLRPRQPAPRELAVSA